MPLLQIFLVGQERLLEVVINPTMAQLHQRLIAACHLNPLNIEQSEAYIKHRLGLVGWQQDPRLDDDIFTLIHKHSRGVPRKINLLCNRLFISGFVDRKHEFTARDVQHVVEELRRERLVHSEDDVAKKSSQLLDYASQDSVPSMWGPSETEQASNQQAISFPRIYQRSPNEADKKPAVPPVARGRPRIHYRHGNTIIVITIGFLLGIFLTLTLLNALNLQKFPTSVLLSQDGEALNKEALYIVHGGEENSKEAAIQLKNKNPASHNEQPELIEEVSSDAGRAPDNASTGELKERQILTRPMDPHGALQQRKESDQQTQLNWLIDHKSGVNSKVETPQPNSMASVGNESMLVSQGREGDELLEQNIHTITQLLANAGRQRKAFKLTIPQGDNARETYQRVLALDPMNEEANKGLNELLQYYLQWASYYKKKGLFESSLDFIYRGLTVEPNNAELLVLKEQVQLSLKRAGE